MSQKRIAELESELNWFRNNAIYDAQAYAAWKRTLLRIKEMKK